jgi:hypothetical protein
MSDPFNSGTAGISLALDVPFPANVESGPGIEVDKTNGNWTVGLGYPPLVDAGVPANPSTIYLAAYDTGLQAYEKLRLDNIIAGATGLDSRTPRGDADYTILVGDRYLALTGTLTAVRTWTLPPAASVPPGRVVTIQDEAGGISGQNHLNVVPTGADTIDGLPNYRLKARYGGLSFRSDGSSKWSVVYSWQVTLIADANYTVQQGDLTVAYSSITAPRVIALPLANAYPSGQRLTIIDFSGSCTGTNNIAVARAGADLINGATSQSITQAYGYLAFVSDGVSKWTIVDSSVVSGSMIVGGTINGVPIGNVTPSTGAFTTLAATTLGITGGGFKVGGRLTLTSGVPVLSANVAAATSIFFTPYEGNLVPLWNGTQLVWTPCVELSNVLANSSTGSAGPAACVASTLYDLFVWNNAGTPTLTRGPAWSNNGAGTSARANTLTVVNGINVNTSAITNGPAAGFGTYVGTFMTDSGGGTVSFSRGGLSAGGTAAQLNIWNMFNRVSIGVLVGDLTASWTYNVASWRAANNSAGNRINFVCGLSGADAVDVSYMCHVLASASSGPAINIGLNQTTAVFASCAASFSSSASVTVGVRDCLLPVLGFNFISALEITTVVGTAVTFSGSIGLGGMMQLTGMLRM